MEGPDGGESLCHRQAYPGKLQISAKWEFVGFLRANSVVLALGM